MKLIPGHADRAYKGYLSAISTNPLLGLDSFLTTYLSRSPSIGSA
jgi:hypothetical protein